jgi:signal transduction histidine kinase/FixJ family two-component response regulator
MLYISNLTKRLGQAAHPYSINIIEESTLKLGWVVFGISTVVWITLGITSPGLLSLKFNVTAFLFILLGLLLTRLSKTLSIGTFIAWEFLFSLIVTAALVFYPNSSLQYIFLILPSVAVATVGWFAGAVVEVYIVILLAGLSTFNISAPVNSPIFLGMVIGSVFLSLLAWSTTGSLFDLTRWSVNYYENYREELERLRSQQANFLEVQSALLHSNNELARMNKQQILLQHAADAARQAKSDFVAKVSHEFRTPLNMIISYSEMIAGSPSSYRKKLPTALLADISIIYRNANHLSRLIEDVLDLSQIEASRMVIHKERTLAAQLVDEAVAVVQPLYLSKKLYLKMDIESDLPVLYCDPTRIRQILINLLSNSGRFTQQGGVTVQVSKDENSIVFSVTDTGSGIAKEDQGKLFQPFQQVEKTFLRDRSGSGLGLSISKHLVELHEGSIWLESEEGFGTRIAFSLPLKTDLPLDPAAHPAPAHIVNEFSVSDFQARLQKVPAPVVRPRVLIIENGSALSHLFYRYSDLVEVALVDDIQKIRSVLANTSIQGIIINSPILYDFGQQADISSLLNELPADIPAVLCWQPGKAEIARRLGAVDYLVKPFKITELLDEVYRWGKGAKKLLVVDDDPDLIQLYTRVLQSSPAGYQILRAETCFDALEILHSSQPDLMILDLVMPEMTGYDLLREKNNDPTIRDIPVLIVSSTDTVVGSPMNSPILVKGDHELNGQEMVTLLQRIMATLSPEKRLDEPGVPGGSPS